MDRTITIHQMVDRLATDGDRDRALGQIAAALDALGLPAREAYTPSEVVHVAVTIGRGLKADALRAPNPEVRQLIEENFAVLEQLEQAATYRDLADEMSKA